MDNTKSYKHKEVQERVELAHRRVTGESLGDVKIALLVKHNAWLLSDLMNKTVEPYGISGSGYITLVALYSSPENTANPSEVCLAARETRSNMTRLTDELVAKGLIKRVPSEEDRRRVDLSLTEAGIALLQVVIPLMRQRTESIFSVFTPEMKAVFETELLKLNQAIEAHL